MNNRTVYKFKNLWSYLYLYIYIKKYMIVSGSWEMWEEEQTIFLLFEKKQIILKIFFSSFS